MSDEHIINDNQSIQDSIIRSLTNLYLFGYYIDIHSGWFVRIELSNASVQHNASDNTLYNNERSWFLNNIVTDEYRQKLTEFTDVSTIEERLRGQAAIFEDYIGHNGAWVRCAYIPADYDEDGHLTHVLFIGQNIDASRKKELKQQQELHELNEKLMLANEKANTQLDTVMSGIRGGYFISEFSPEHRFIHVSHAAALNQGYASPDELIRATDNNAINNIYAPDRRIYLDNLEKQLAYSNSYSFKYRTICKDGSTKWVMDSGKVNTDEQGHKVIHSLLLDIDRTEKTARMYKEERLRYREAILNDCEYSFTIDLTDGIIEQGYTARKDDKALPLENYHFPTPLTEHIESVWSSFKLVGSDNSIYGIMSRNTLLADYSRGKRNVEAEYYDKSRDMFIRVTTLMSKSDSTGHIIAIVIGRDITAIKKEQEQARRQLTIANAQLKQACVEAELANAAKTDFLARMSHDIRTPLNGILGLLEIAGRCSDDPEKVENCRQKAILAANHLLSLLNDVLDMSKLESGDVLLAEESFNMNDLLFQTHEIMSGQMAVKNITDITVTQEPLPHPNVIGSPVHVRQILTNLISNAIKYNKQNGTIRASMEETALDDDTVTFRFTISDTGIGMSEEFVKHIFEPFARENEKLNSKVSGTGLGMSIVKKLTDKMNGTIEIESTKDVGSTFKVTIPFKRDKINTACDSIAMRTGSDLKGLHILLVEDNELNCEVAQYLLTDEGAVVDIAPNGQIAVDVFSQKPAHYYDVILMDMMMPVLDGCGATRAIRSMEREDAGTIPIIALTANAFSDDVSRCHEAGMNAHLSKPLDINATIKTIRYYTGK